MKKFVIENIDSDQRLDKYLKRRLPLATASFCYKMLRKKNITLNGRKADGSEKLKTGDEVVFFLSDETFAGFAGTVSDADEKRQTGSVSEYTEAYREIAGKYRTSPVLYEDEDILLVHKRPGILSQKAHPEDHSMNEWLIGYLLETDQISRSGLNMYKPSVCNRLDRNTGGILICAKTVRGSRKMAELLKERGLRKFYRMVVQGKGLGAGTIEGYLVKDEHDNIVQISKNSREGAVYSETRIRTVEEGPELSLIEAELITGKTHQLRAHLAYAGHPIAGDMKYGDQALNHRLIEKAGVRFQMLYACRLVFPEMDGEWERLSKREFSLPMPASYLKTVRTYRT